MTKGTVFSTDLPECAIDFDEIECPDEESELDAVPEIYKNAVRQSFYTREVAITTVDDPSLYCWHCVHPFEGVGLPIATRRERITGRWICFGNFCSPQCANTYSREKGGVGLGARSSVTDQMYRELFKLEPKDRIGYAPRRERLAIFSTGGLSIEEFRRNHILFQEEGLPAPMTVITLKVAQTDLRKKQKMNQEAREKREQSKDDLISVLPPPETRAAARKRTAQAASGRIPKKKKIRVKRNLPLPTGNSIDKFLQTR